jgi:hypothetical protein
LSAVNPYVGLRPFRTDEAVLFFGRRQQTTELVERLHRSRFVAVVGSSASGKSSLVFAGLLPQLQAGFLVQDRDKWLIVRLTPGEAPLARLAADFELTATDLRESAAQAILDVLQRDAESLRTNCLIVVDQFEELFRFTLAHGNRDEAAEFVEVLLQIVDQTAFPVFVVITMRSDFIGDCDVFRGLPEALNRSQYLVPRLTRQQLRESIEGPARLFGAHVSPRLLDRVSNEVAGEPDQLPVLQLALMRTWEHFKQRESSDVSAGSPRDAEAGTEPKNTVNVQDYLDVGGVGDAVSRDAESAMRGMSDAQIGLTRQVFQALTDTDNSNRRVRRPVRLSQLEQITGAGRAQILEIIDRFREGGRSFLIVQEILASDDLLIDISHEALIRRWERLTRWVDEEAASKRVYLDLVHAVSRKKALLHDSDLQGAIEWRNRVKPSAAWAERYAPGFAAAMAYIEESEQEHAREVQQEVTRRQESERARRLKWLLVGCALVVLALGVVAWSAYRSGRAAANESEIARKARDEAELQRRRAEGAFELIQKSLLIRQAALAGDEEALSRLTATVRGSTIRFTARETDLKYKNPAGDQIYKFELFPDPATLPKGNAAVAFVTYLADHPTFQNTLMTAGAKRDFVVSYTGWGCLHRIVALIEYKDPTRPAEATEFDMCKEIGWCTGVH